MSTETVGGLVLGSDYRALGVVRSLGRRGIPVWVISEGDDTLALRSRYTHRHIAFRGRGDVERCEFLLGLAERHGLDGWVVFPSADETAALVGRMHDTLSERYRLTSPPWAVLRWAYDKRLTYQMADMVGLPFPRTWPARGICESDVDLPFPVIIKPAVKERFNALTAAKAWRVEDRRELKARMQQATALLDPDVLMIQEVIPSLGAEQLSFAALCRSGEPVASVTARRLRQYPADFGRASTCVTTVDAPDAAANACAFLAECRFDGLVEVEFIRDPRDGALKLLDANPRVWGWHTLCRRAGVDFPYLAYLNARSLPVGITASRPGVNWLRWTTDLPTSLHEIVRGNLSPTVYLGTVLRSHESATFARDDVRPGFWEIPMLMGTLMRRLRHGDAV